MKKHKQINSRTEKQKIIDLEIINEFLLKRSIDRFNGAGIPVGIPHNKKLRS
jgi:hypothetical protein